jgi:hypothetical protein
MTRSVLSVLSAFVLACSGGPDAPGGEITGTWGGDDAGLIVADSATHVHIGCTSGDVAGSILPDASGRFDVGGEYTVDAHPVGPGTTHPARFSGRVTGNTMVLSVSLSDTSRTFGPVTLTFDRTPEMGPCPICRMGG